MDTPKQPLIRNKLAQSFLELSGRDSGEVVKYLEERKKVENEPEQLKVFEDTFRCSNKRADYYCAITDLMNRRPYLMIGGCIAFLYNVVWVVYKLVSG